MINPAFRDLNKLLNGRVRADESMKKHTSWRIGGPSEIFVEPTSREEIRLVTSYAKQRGIPLTIIGAGSNLLVCEGGVKGLIVKIGSGMSKISIAGCEITAEAGAKLSRVAVAARDAGLGGFEFSAGIPGSVGGAVVMNAGANGSSIGGLVRDVLIFDLNKDFYRKTQEEMDFGYRSSVLQREPSIIVESSFSCHPRNKDEIKEEMNKYISWRKLTQPLEQPNAGSVFKNPPGDSAGRLIESAGLKGLRIGDAQISILHANFIVNLGSATAWDVRALIDRVRETVRSRFGVELIPEVKIIGED